MLRKEKNKYKREIKRFLIVTLAALLMAFNLKSFVHTGGLFPGGFSGITLLIQQSLSTFFYIDLPYAFIYIPLNMIPIYIGIKYIGRGFTIYSTYFIIVSGFLTDAMPDITITSDILLVAIFGGILNGTAVCTCLLVDASGGGTDFISIFLSERKGIDAWNYILAGNLCVLVTAGILFGFDKALYSIIFQFCSTQVINTFYKRYQKHTMLIITSQPNVVYGRIKELTHHDATLFKGIGCYQGVERKMLYSVVSSDEVNSVMKAIKEVDPKAFVNVMKTEQINGRFYKPPKL